MNSENIGWGANLIVDGLWVGSFMSSMNLAPLEKHRITHIINCTNEFPCRFSNYFHYLHIKLKDQTHQNIISSFPQAIAFINEVMEQNGAVLIHCGNGSSRSGSIAIAFLLFEELKKEKKQRDLDAIIECVKTRRPKIQPNPGFFEQLRLFQSWNCTLPDILTSEQQNLLRKYRLPVTIEIIEKKPE